jgi:hypothetical protein
MIRLGLRFALAATVGSAIFFGAGCQQLNVKDQIKNTVLPQEAKSPWITSFGDRSVTVTWAEPSDPDMGAVEIIATPTFAAGVAPIQAVVGAGTQTVTLSLPTNNAPYTISVYMVDKGGNVSKIGVSTKTGYSPHYYLDSTGIATYGSFPPSTGSFPQLNTFASQLPIKTVTHFSGIGAGVYAGYDTYTYDSATGLPSSITTYSAAGAPTSRHDISYATGGINRILDLHYTYSGLGPALDAYVNTFYDSNGHTTRTECYRNVPPPFSLTFASTYSLDASGTITGWVTSDGTGTVTGKFTHAELGTREQWSKADPSGMIVQGGLIECDFDSAGRPSAFIGFNTNDMSVASRTLNQYDANGNLLKVTYIGSVPLQQLGFDVFAY